MRLQAPREYTIVDMARAFCIAAHTGVEQKRKYTHEDYHHHPEEALQILLTYCEPTWAQQAAILLHDVIEDTGVMRKHIAQVFGQEVSRLVWGVTDVSRKEDGNRETRKRLDREHILRGCNKILEMKLADLISNTRSIAKHDKKFAKVYLTEKLQILKDMHERMQHEAIYEEAWEVAIAGLKETLNNQVEVFDMVCSYLPEEVPYDKFMRHYYPEVADAALPSNDSVKP